MRNLFVKIAQALETIEQDKGRFEIKCLVASDLIEPLWDLVLTADWFQPDQKAALEYLTNRIMPGLDYACMTIFSGIVTYPVDSKNPLVLALSRIQENHRQGMYEYMRADELIAIPVHLPQARLVVPFDDRTAPEVQRRMGLAQMAP